MPNTSSTGGYLQPVTTVLEDQALRRFLQQIVSGITGLDGTLVRPRWQQEPLNAPDINTDWCAIGVISRTRDIMSFRQHVSSNFGDFGFGQGPFGGESFDLQHRNQVLSILASFYGPNADGHAEVFSNGFDISQNRETMTLGGFGLVEVSGPLVVPSLDAERWRYRVDVPFRVRRAQVYTYPVLDIESAEVSANLETLVESTKVSRLPAFAWGVNGPYGSGWGLGNWSDV